MGIPILIIIKSKNQYEKSNIYNYCYYLSFITIFFGKTRLYYYNSYNLFLLINEKNITNGELKISKNIFSFKNKIEFGHYGELPIFYMVPKNGQIYICDYWNNITKIHSEDIYLYYTKNDVKTKLSDKIIYITWDVIPVIYDAEKKTILNVQRLL